MAATTLRTESPSIGRVAQEARLVGQPATGIRYALIHLPRRLCPTWDGSSWEPGRSWLTRVEDWDHPQEPR